MLPCELYRTSVRQLCTQYRSEEGSNYDADFFQYLEANYNQSKQRLVELNFSDDNEQLAIRNALFVFSVGVFAYGKIGAAKDILDNIPSSGHVQRLALSLKAMLPLPKDLKPIKDNEIINDWLDSNISLLVWNETSGVYEYRETK